ncbi:MAG: PqqD family protein [Pseudomonadota bacterium]|uniref:PqqD family protein n=1 Tax=Candidatus Desulfatibia profunda TaxID=2841695 RepID=A0A8J6THF4_9BACT|nr:PqqD family protein [Candidatus Desulfatibia profunda]
MNSAKRYIKNNNIVFREEDDGAFLFDPDTGNLKYLNKSAKETFLMIDGQNDSSQITNRLLKLYPDEDSEQVRNDVESFLQELLSNNFVFHTGGN